MGSERGESMKLEVGMYVRTDKDIFQIRNKNVFIEDKKQYIGVNGRYTCIDIETIKKASHNIIDLIEVGDYVNGMNVMDADWINEEGDYEEGLAFPMYASDDLNIIENWQPLKYIKIKSIVTKEQFESMSYKVGD